MSTSASQVPREPMVPWVTYGLLLRGDLAGASDLALADGVRLVGLPEWVHSTPAVRWMSERTRESLREFKYALAVEYQADSFGMPDPTLQPGEDGRSRSIQEHAERRLVLAALALWLVRPTRETVEHVVHARNDGGNWFAPRVAAGTNVILPHPRDEGQHLSAEVFHEAAPLHASLLVLPEDGALFVALGALMQGLRATSTTMRFIMCWVAAEAVFGAAHEVSFRLSTRVAAFLRPNGPEREALFRDVHQGYGWRSKVVHGAGLAKFTHGDWLRESHVLETWLREALRKILLSKSIATEIQSRGREQYLDRLQFSEADATGRAWPR